MMASGLLILRAAWKREISSCCWETKIVTNQIILVCMHEEVQDIVGSRRRILFFYLVVNFPETLENLPSEKTVAILSLSD